MTLPLAIDSGAFSFYMKVASRYSADGKRLRGFAHADHTYSEKKDFAEYLDAYCEFIRAYGDQFEYCVALDVIGSPEKSLAIYRDMTKQGLRVLPVYHFGEPIKYLKAYMDSTDYIGLGGLVKTGTKSASSGFRERTWKYLCDAKGKPLRKVHAFGMTSFEPMIQHPYYSVDSTTSFTWSRYGCIMVPHIHAVSKEFDFANVPRIYPLTPGRSKTRTHLDHMHPTGHNRAAIDRYVAELGVPLESLRSEYGARDTANLYFMNRMMKAVSLKHSQRCGSEVTMLYYASGNFSTTLPEFNKSLSHLEKMGALEHLAYLGTYAQLNPLARLFKDWRGMNITDLQHRGKMV